MTEEKRNAPPAESNQGPVFASRQNAEPQDDEDPQAQETGFVLEKPTPPFNESIGSKATAEADPLIAALTGLDVPVLGTDKPVAEIEENNQDLTAASDSQPMPMSKEGATTNNLKWAERNAARISEIRDEFKSFSE